MSVRPPILARLLRIRSVLKESCAGYDIAMSVQPPHALATGHGGTTRSGDGDMISMRRP